MHHTAVLYMFVSYPDLFLLTFHGAALPPLVADHDGLLVLPLPRDGRLRVASKKKIFIWIF